MSNPTTDNIIPEHSARDMKNDLHPEVKAAYAYVDRVLHTADIQAGLSPAWYGWAIREAFLAGCSHAAALAQPEPVAPTDEELTDMAEFYIEDNGLLGLHNAGEFARAVLARWGTPTNALPTPEATNV